MTNEEKLKVLRDTIAEVWSSSFAMFKWEQSQENPNVYVLSGKAGNSARTPYLAGCHDTWGNMISIDYNPEKDLLGIYVKDRPIQSKFKEDLEGIFAKHTPFDMILSFEEDMTPVIFRKERVEVKDFADYLKGFCKAYDEYYPLFYMLTVCATAWYDGFCIANSYCVDGVYY